MTFLMKSLRRSVAVAMLTVLVNAPFTNTLRAQVREKKLVPEDIERWCDEFLPARMEEGSIAGAAVAVVQDGATVFQKGYGYADIVRRTAVDPQQTLFRVGSIGKLVTWTAIMQLVDQGKVDLDVDINGYLDFTISPTFSEPVTLRHIMTHTSGFEDRMRCLFTDEVSNLLSLEQYVKTVRPARIFPPGRVHSYNNYATALAGYIVQRVSGQSFDDYVEQRIFHILRMNDSTFRQPMPQRFRQRMSNGYADANAAPFYYELVSATPAGSLCSTAADMAKFMVAQLDVETTGSPLFSQAMGKEFHRRHFRLTPPVHGMTLGFFEREYRGHAAIEHAGDTQIFHSNCVLFIDDGIGLFLAMNSSGENGSYFLIRSAFTESFCDGFLSRRPMAEATSQADSTTSFESPLILTGVPYESTRRNESSVLLFRSAFRRSESVQIDESGGFVFPDCPPHSDGTPMIWRQVAMDSWRADGDTTAEMRAMINDGRVEMVAFDPLGGAEMYQPMPTWRSPRVCRPILISIVIIATSNLAVWVISFWRMISRRKSVPDAVSRYKLDHITAVGTLATVVSVWGWYRLSCWVDESDLTVFDGRLDVWIRLAQAVTLVSVLGVISAAIQVARHRFRSGRRINSFYYSLILSALSCFNVGALYLNLYSWTIQY